MPAASDVLDFLGPVEHFVVVVPDGEVTDELVAPIAALVASDTIIVLDVEVISRSDDALRVLDPATVHSALAPFSSQLLDGEDVLLVGEQIPDGGLAVVVVYEDAWVHTLAEKLAERGAQLVSQGPVWEEDLVARLDELDAAAESA